MKDTSLSQGYLLNCRFSSHCVCERCEIIMQKSKGKGITDTLPVHMQHTAYIFLIHEKPFSPAETREKYKNLPCRSVCRGPEDLIDSEK